MTNKNKLNQNDSKLKRKNEELIQLNKLLSESNQKLTKSEEHYRLLTESSADVFWVFNIKHENFTYISPSVYNLRGYTVEEAMQLSIDQSLTPESANKAKQLISIQVQEFIKSENSSKSYLEDFQQLCKNGDIIWIETSAKYRYNSEREIELFGISRNISDKKSAEIDLQESEIQFRTLFETSNDPIEIIKNGRHFACNQARLDILKINSKEEYLKLKPWDITPKFQPDGNSSNKKILEMFKIVQDAGSNEFEWVNTDTLGKNILFNTSLTKVVRNGENYIYAIFRNITKQKETENALVESENLYRTLFENAIVPISIIQNEQFVDCNQALLFALQLKSKGDFYKLNPWDISPEFQPDGKSSKLKARGMMNLALEKGNHEFEWMHKDTEENNIWFSISLTKILINNEITLYTIWRDISSQKETEKIIVDSERKLKQIFNNIQAGLVLSKDRKITFINQYITNKFGYSSEELFGIDAKFIYPSKEEFDLVGKKIQTGLKNKHSALIETKIKSKNGKIFDVLMGVVYYNGENYGDGIISVVTDITEQKQAEAKLKRVNDEKDKLFSIISHDLRAPFNSILGYTNLLIEDFFNFDDETKLSSIFNVHSSAKKAFQLLENLLSWSRSQLGQIKYNPEIIEVKDFVYETLYMLNDVITQKEIKIINNVNSGIYVKADKQTSDTVLRNLITNAVKFTNRTGTITISASLEKTENKVEISVSDNGVGIPPNNIDKLFNIEKNISTNGTENEHGTGLGLILCKEFTENNGGEIWAESEYGKGATFRFTLPSRE